MAPSDDEVYEATEVTEDECSRTSASYMAFYRLGENDWLALVRTLMRLVGD